jgi:putative hydrolase of the HAD superfamily
LARWKRNWGETLADALRRVDPEHHVTSAALRPHLQTGFPWHDAASVRPAALSPDAWWSAMEPVFARAYRVCGVDDTAAQQAAGHVRGAFVNWRDFARDDDALPALRAVAEHDWTQVILSNHVPELPAIVAALHLHDFIERVFTSAALRAEKPNALAFRAVLDAYPGAHPVVMVGDNPVADVAGARAVGLRAIQVRANVSSDDAVVRLSEVPDRLESGT